MRRLPCLVLLAAWRIAAAAGNPRIDASDVAFGLVNTGSSAVRYINIANTDSQPSTLTVTAAQVGGNTGGWFSFVGDGCAGAQTACVFIPALSITDHATVVAIRCAPPLGATGTQTVTVTFTSTSADSTHAVSTLTCTASGDVLETIPAAVLDFGPVDLERQPLSAASLVRVHNAGTTTITTGAGMPGGPDVARFGFSSLAPHVLAPDASFDITVTYTPNAERTANAPDLAVLDIPFSGVDGATAIGLILKGYGVDRHASIAKTPRFDPTFVGPDAAPMLPITIENTGGAPLGLSNPMITGSPTWGIVAATPVDVPGHSTFDVLVRFTPQAVGPAPDATFSIATTDPAVPVLSTTIIGSGIDRAVTLGPATIDMHFAGIGTTAHLSDGTRGALLQAVNADPANDFVIRHISVLGGEGAFRVEDTTGVIPAHATRSFDITFTPTHAGAYDATAVLFLDASSIPQASVALHGEGVYVGAVGGGGCAVGSGSGIVLVLVLVLVLVRRRWALVAAVVLCLVAAARADTRNLDLAIFDPTPTTTSPTFQLQSADVGREGDWSATALATYANEPLVLVTAPNDNVAIADRMTLALGGAFAFGDRFEIGLHMPLYVQSGENLNSATMFGEPPASGTARGDLTLNAKARLVRRHGRNGTLVAGAGLGLALPTASNEAFAGSAKPQLHALALISLTPAALDNKLDLIANAGAVIRATAEFHDVHQGDALAWGIGASFHARPALAFAAELFGELVPGGIRDAMGATSALDTIEALAGVHYQMDRRVNIGVALGRGLTTGIGAPAVRGVLTVTFAPTTPQSIGTRYVAGDHDRDGVPDDVDKCPDEPEDKDGFEDDDGCPDPDNDHDGIADAKDKCPNVAEDRDGFEDEDGCPDPDNDHDGIPDRFDHCPNQPETINGIDDEDGCPDAGEGLVKLAGDHLEIGEPIKFSAAGKLAPESFNALGQLGATLRAHTELAKIRIVAHVLAPHAQAVVDWLVQYGIAAARLEATFAGDGSLDEHIDVLVAQ
jgi:hypothetical protein